jgi:hypothetical protein
MGSSTNTPMASLHTQNTSEMTTVNKNCYCYSMSRVIRERRWLHYEELHNLYSATTTTKVTKLTTRWKEDIARRREMKNSCKMLTEKPERKKLLVKIRRK